MTMHAKAVEIIARHFCAKRSINPDAGGAVMATNMQTVPMWKMYIGQVLDFSAMCAAFGIITQTLPFGVSLTQLIENDIEACLGISTTPSVVRWLDASQLRTVLTMSIRLYGIDLTDDVSSYLAEGNGDNLISAYIFRNILERAVQKIYNTETA